MTDEADQILRATDKPLINENKSDSRTESDPPMMSTSSNAAAAKIADTTVPYV
jgi:hypothetical protein